MTRVFRYPSDRHGSSAFAIGMLRYVAKKPQNEFVLRYAELMALKPQTGSDIVTFVWACIQIGFFLINISEHADGERRGSVPI